MRRAALVFLLGLALDSLPSRGEPPRLGASFTLTQPAALAMIWIAPGTVYLSDPVGADDDTEATLTRGYWLGRTEVTQAQWAAVVAHHPLFQNEQWPSRARGSDRPVEQVRWNAAMIFCSTLTALERDAGRLPDGYEYTLPTEAQWEYAARAGATGKYVGELDATTWYEANSGGATHPVAQKQPNAWGLCDMQGNVAEWCWDWYAPYPGGGVNDPMGPANGVHRVIRGSSFISLAGSCRVAQRWRWPPYLKSPAIGFRVALAPIRPTPVVPTETLSP